LKRCSAVLFDILYRWLKRCSAVLFDILYRWLKRISAGILDISDDQLNGRPVKESGTLKS